LLLLSTQDSALSTVVAVVVVLAVAVAVVVTGN